MVDGLTMNNNWFTAGTVTEVASAAVPGGTWIGGAAAPIRGGRAARSQLACHSQDSHGTIHAARRTHREVSCESIFVIGRR